MLWSVPACLIFIKGMSISPNGDTNTSVTCDRTKRAFLLELSWSLINELATNYGLFHSQKRLGGNEK